MTTLIDDVPEAQKFIEDVKSHLSDYLLFKDERFDWIGGGVLSTSQVDRAGERFLPAALAGFVERSKCEVIWQLVEHNPLIQPVGRIIAAELFYHEGRDLHFIAGEIGQYAETQIRSFSDIGIDVTSQEDGDLVDVAPPGAEASAEVSFIPADFDDETIQELMSGVPAEVSIVPRRDFRKSAEQIAVLRVVAGIWLLVANPFSRAFLERLGSKVADGVIAFAGWLKEKAGLAIRKARSRRRLLVIQTNVAGCMVEFVYESIESDTVVAAADSLPRAARSAVSLVNRMAHLGPEKLVYVYEPESRRWLPRHAATREAGVISDNPVLVALDRLKGLSIGGRGTAERD